MLWTDLTRAEVERAELHPDTPRLAGIAEFITWARENQVLVIDTFEVFNRDAPMTNRRVALAEIALRRGYGYAAASLVTAAWRWPSTAGSARGASRPARRS